MVLIKNKICYIVGAGENYGLDFTPRHGDYIIGADGGYTYLEENGYRADLVIGDFDTLLQKPNHPNTITLNREKDDTDTLAAVREGIKKGYEAFHIYCGTGGRIDHTIANIQVLAYLSKKNMKGLLFDMNSIMTVITNGKLAFGGHMKGYVSVFSYSEKAEGVCISGMKYPLDKAVLSNTFPIGVSNELVGCESSISVESGTLLVIFPRY